MSAREVMVRAAYGLDVLSLHGSKQHVDHTMSALQASGYVTLSPDEVRELADGLQCAISSMAGECEGNHRIALNTLDRAIRSRKGGRDAQ